jgi:predicted MFS family arabinose efflux permease
MDTALVFNTELTSVTVSAAFSIVLGTAMGVLLGWHLAVAIVRGLVNLIVDGFSPVWPRRLPHMTPGEKKTLASLSGGVDTGQYIRGLVIADAEKRGVPWPIDE